MVLVVNGSSHEGLLVDVALAKLCGEGSIRALSMIPCGDSGRSVPTPF